MKRFAAVALALSAVALVGCSTQTQALGTPEQGLEVLREQYPEMNSVPDEMVFDLSRNICQGMDRGATVEDAIMAVYSGGIEPDLSGALVALAFATECPEYLHLFDEYT